jgi:hypothetical protein
VPGPGGMISEGGGAGGVGGSASMGATWGSERSPGYGNPANGGDRGAIQARFGSERTIFVRIWLSAHLTLVKTDE